MGLNELRPVAYTIAPFVTTRCLEQIRVDVCYHEAPVTIVAVGAGMAYSSLGPTHHSCEDIALLRAIPNIVVICPGDSFEVRAALRESMKQDRPVYIRLGKKGEPVVHPAPLKDFAIGRAIKVSDGKDVCLMSTGNMLPEAVEAARRLGAQGISAQVVSFHTVKPLDEACLTEVFARFKLVATIEEHSLIGGFGAAVSEWLADSDVDHQKFLRFGSPDSFFTKSGEQTYAREMLGLTGRQIGNKIAFVLR
jgi:transketolase